MEKFKLFFKSILSRDTLHFLRFLRKIPSLYLQDKLIASHKLNEYSPNKIFIKASNEIYPIFSPDILNEEIKPNSMGIRNTGFIRTYNIFLSQANSWYQRKEINNFVKYAKKSYKFADLGSAEGFYSALFASIHREKAEILSVDCFSEQGSDVEKIYILKKQNSEVFKPRVWQIARAFLSDQNEKDIPWKLSKNVDIISMTDLFLKYDFYPDLIKFDIESYEYDVLQSSMNYLKKNKPTLIIEIHNLDLNRRGLNFKNILEDLFKIGYKIKAKDENDYLVKDSHLILSCDQ